MHYGGFLRICGLLRRSCKLVKNLLAGFAIKEFDFWLLVYHWSWPACADDAAESKIQKLKLTWWRRWNGSPPRVTGRRFFEKKPSQAISGLRKKRKNSKREKERERERERERQRERDRERETERERQRERHKERERETGREREREKKKRCRWWRWRR